MHVSSLRRLLPRGRGLSVVLFLAMASVTHACLWDWDTLQMERRRFPGTLEMITGKFVRHSPAYYQWRIQDRTKRLGSPAEDPGLADDLAVAYSKLGRHAEGIALLEQVLAAHPDRYETLANLGTIHMLAGDLKTGKEYVDRAIVINPNAHFGREKYQSLLAEYFLTARKSPHPVAEFPDVIRSKDQAYGFAKFVLKKQGHERVYFGLEDSKRNQEMKAELATAQKGVLGMMHFANYDSPLLLEALGDLLIAWPTSDEDAVQLAARCYYRVAQTSEDDATKDEFKKAAANTLYGHWDYINHEKAVHSEKETFESILEKLNSELTGELAEARTYFDAIAADERRWIAERVNVDQAFATKYYDSLESTIEAAKKQLAIEPRDERGYPPHDQMKRGLLILGSVVTGFALTIWGVMVAWRRRRMMFGK